MVKLGWVCPKVKSSTDPRFPSSALPVLVVSVSLQEVTPLSQEPGPVKPQHSLFVLIKKHHFVSPTPLKIIGLRPPGQCQSLVFMPQHSV